MMGSASPTPCLPGTHQDALGQTTCAPCPSSYFCDGSTVAPEPCPIGYYCPNGTRFGEQNPCPPGTFSNVTLLSRASQCSPCPGGYYCDEPATVTPSRLCGAGHYCASGCSIATPIGDCGDLCDGGHVCLRGASVPDPVNGTTSPASPVVGTGYVCGPGTYCPRGSLAEVPCPPGTWNPLTGQLVCDACPVGRSCPIAGLAAPLPCPLTKYCDGGDAFGNPCPPGRYGHAENVTSAASCAVCPRGQYCIDGNVTAPCAAGYVCWHGNAVPDPQNAAGDDDPDGEPCPAGSYCPEGALEPIFCPNGTFSVSLRATSVAACGPCPEGFRCIEGNPVPIPCSFGHYCPPSSPELPCPAGTYNPVQAATNFSACLGCPGGYLCQYPATGSLDGFPCPAGSFCPPGSLSAVPCGAGRYRSHQNGASSDDCSACPGGFTCGNGTVTPVPCVQGTYCPPGSSSPSTCQPSYFCPSQASSMLPCPAGYYCSGNSTIPLLCPAGRFCPLRSAVPLQCPRGYRTVADSSNVTRTSLALACRECGPGTFSDEVGSSSCTECPAGFVCVGGTTSATPQSLDADNGYVCPVGHFCPAGSAKELPCMAGYYNPSAGKGNTSDACVPCEAGAFQSDLGQSSCLTCSASSTSGTAATTCDCLGVNRVFQPSDGLCICAPGYEFVDETFTKRSQEDGVEPCQPIVYDYCVTGQTRTPDGTCVARSSTQCPSCGNGTGTLIARTGVCQCDNFVPLEDVCDAACRAFAPTLSINPFAASSGNASAPLLVLTERDPDTGAVVQTQLSVEDIPGFTGTLLCTHSAGGDAASTGSGVVGAGGAALPPTSGHCIVVLVSMTPTGMQGLYDVTPQITDAESSAARRLSAGQTLPVVPRSAAAVGDVVAAAPAEQSFAVTHALHSLYRSRRLSQLRGGRHLVRVTCLL